MNALIEAREAALEKLEALAAEAATRSLTEDEAASFDALESEIAELDKRMAAHKRADELRKAQPVTVNAEVHAVAKPAGEARSVEVKAVSPYAAEQRTVSWFKDRATLTNPDASNAEVDEARERLGAHYESAMDEGAARQVRAYSVGTASEGGYLAAPQYLQDAFADYLTAGRPTADLVGKMALPAQGATFYLPTQTGASAVAVHTENGAVTETSATFGQVQIDAARVAGLATLPNWLVDRSFPGADQVVLADLSKQYAAKIDDIVLNSSTTNRKGLLQEAGLGGATATAATPTVATYWPALLNAINDVASGVFSYPDAIVMHPRRWAYLASLLDSSNRPLIGSLAPQNAAASFDGVNVPGSGMGPMAAGNILGIPVYLDANIPVNLGAGTNEDRIIVMKRSEPILMESAPKFAVSLDNQFGKDQLVARVTGDVAFTCARRKAAVSIISGTALAATV